MGQSYSILDGISGIQSKAGHYSKEKVAERRFDLRTSGLWAQHASTAPLCYHNFKTKQNVITRFYLMQSLNLGKKYFVRSGIRTHAHRSGLRPERSALDHSAILT